MDEPPAHLPPIDPLDPHTSAVLRSAVLVPSLAAAALELARNAVDAGARRVDVWLDTEDAGVCVTDDGRGIGARELKRVGERFVSNSSGFGYRGESLASMAALGLLEITSRTAASRHAHTKIIKGSDVLVCGQSPRPHAIGTTVTVRSLFSPLPVRATQLGAAAASTVTSCVRAVERLALVVPGVRWTVWEGIKKRLDVKGESSLDVFRSLHGDGFAEHVGLIDVSSGLRRATGFISLRGSVSRSHQHLYLNSRPVPPSDLHAWMAKRLAGLLALDSSGGLRSPRRQERYPVYVLNVMVPADLGRDPGALAYNGDVQAFVHAVVDEFIRRQSTTAPLVTPALLKTPPRKTRRSQSRTPAGAAGSPASPSPLRGLACTVRPSVTAAARRDASPTPARAPVASHDCSSCAACTKSPAPVPQAEHLTSGPSLKRKPEWLEALAKQVDTVLPFPAAPLLARPYPVDIHFDPTALAAARVLGQIDRKFIACVLPTVQAAAAAGRNPSTPPRLALVLIDQHAADERVAYEHLLSAFCAGFFAAQDTVDLAAPVELGVEGERANVEVAVRMLSRWGVGAELDPTETGPAGTATVRVHAVPAAIPRLRRREELGELVRSYVGEVADRVDEAAAALRALEAGSGDTAGAPGAAGDADAWRAVRWMPRVLGELVKSKACRGAIMFGDPLAPEQCARLVDRLHATRLPFVCAHGRPAVVPLGLVGAEDVSGSSGPAGDTINWDSWRRRAERSRG